MEKLSLVNLILYSALKMAVASYGEVEIGRWWRWEQILQWWNGLSTEGALMYVA